MGDALWVARRKQNPASIHPASSQAGSSQLGNMGQRPSELHSFERGVVGEVAGQSQGGAEPQAGMRGEQCEREAEQGEVGRMDEEYVLDFVLERKRVDDLWASVRSKRFKDQKLRLKVRCARHVLLQAVGFRHGLLFLNARGLAFAR